MLYHGAPCHRIRLVGSWSTSGGCRLQAMVMASVCVLHIYKDESRNTSISSKLIISIIYIFYIYCIYYYIYNIIYINIYNIYDIIYIIYILFILCLLYAL